MYAFRTSAGPVDLAFTDRHGGASAAPFTSLNLALEDDDDDSVRGENHRRMLEDFGPGDELIDLRQVHGASVDVVEEPLEPDASDGRPRADAVVSAKSGVTLMVRSADCVPVLLADIERRVIGAAHCGRLGLVAGVVPAVIARMRDLGAERVTAWIGPHICGGCYEVSAELQAEVSAVVPESLATTRSGTPALDIGAGVHAQLDQGGVRAVSVAQCTHESQDLYSYRRDGRGAGRQAGLIRIRP